MVELPVSPAPWPLHHLTFLVPSIPLPAPSMFSPSLKGWLSPEFQLLSCILSLTGPSSTSQLQLLIPFTQSRPPWTSLTFFLLDISMWISTNISNQWWPHSSFPFPVHVTSLFSPWLLVPIRISQARNLINIPDAFSPSAHTQVPHPTIHQARLPFQFFTFLFIPVINILVQVFIISHLDLHVPPLCIPARMTHLEYNYYHIFP